MAAPEIQGSWRLEAATMAPSRDVSQQKLVCPRARKCRPDLSQSEQNQRSKLTSSLQAVATGGEQLGELELILQGQAPDAPNTYLGISPPVRSGFFGGAANPIQHDSTWSACAFNASHSNLQALRELDMQHSFLRCTGDYRLLLGSPDMRSFMEEVAERSSQHKIKILYGIPDSPLYQACCPRANCMAFCAAGWASQSISAPPP